jgi:ABC-type sulfate/molybdate transport systems ATPase subunit
MSALDERLRDEARRLIAELQAEYRVPFILVTHDIRDVRALADRLILLKDGRVLQSGKTSEVLERPASLEAARAVPENQILEIDSRALVFKPWQGQLLPRLAGDERPLASVDPIVYRFSVNVVRAYDEGGFSRCWVKTVDGQGVWIYRSEGVAEKDLDLTIARKDIIEFDLRK